MQGHGTTTKTSSEVEGGVLPVANSLGPVSDPETSHTL